MKQFEKITTYPPELRGRFNSFIVTEFDDSMTIEMKLRVLIKWIKKNIDLTNEMVEYLNKFIETFDEKLYKTVEDILSKWLEDGSLAELIRELINEEVVEARESDGITYDRLKDRLEADKKTVDGKIEKIYDFVDDELEKIYVFADNFNTVQEAIDYACINNKNLLFMKQEYIVDNLTVLNKPKYPIEINFNGATFKSVDVFSNEFMFTVKSNNITFKNLLIDGIGYCNKGINVSNSTDIYFKNIELKNIKVPTINRGSTIGLQVEIDNSDNVYIDGIKISDLSANNNGVIGDWDGSCKGILFTGSGGNNISKSFSLSNIEIDNLVSEDADGIHFQGCGLLPTTIKNFSISNCHSRQIKIQGTYGLSFSNGVLFNTGSIFSRRAFISDYSGSNNMNDINMYNVQSIHGIELFNEKNSYNKSTTISNIYIDLKGEGRIDDELVTAIVVSKVNPDDVLTNYTFSNIYMNASEGGLMLYTHTLNLTVDNLGCYGATSTGKLAQAITMTSPYVAESNQKASHVNARLHDVWASGYPIYFGNTTTFRFSEVSLLKSIANYDPYLVLTSVASNDIVLQPRFYRFNGVPTEPRGVNFLHGDIILNARPHENHLIWGWVCTETGDPGTWKAMYFGQQ